MGEDGRRGRAALLERKKVMRERKKIHHVSYKAEKSDFEALAELSGLLGVNKSEAIRRAVLMALNWVGKDGDQL